MTVLNSQRLAAAVFTCVVAMGCGTTPTIRATQVVTNSVGDAVAAAPRDISRDAAIARLTEQAFLSRRDAACVADALFANVGVYDSNSALAREQGNQPALIDMCVNGAPSTSAAIETAGTSGSEQSGLIVREVQVEPTPTPVPAPFVLDEQSEPAYVPGSAGVGVGTLTLGDKTFDYATITPRGFEAGASAPVFLVFPPGGQDIDMAASVAQFVYAEEAVRRGWVVVTPAVPSGTWADEDNRAIVPDLVRWIDAWVDIEGKPHIGGMSNGGISAFSIAIDHPSLFQSLMVYPGAPATLDDLGRIHKVANMPVRMWVGGDDHPSWIDAVEEAATELEGRGSDVVLEILPGEPHAIESLSNGVAIFDELDDAR